MNISCLESWNDQLAHNTRWRHKNVRRCGRFLTGNSLRSLSSCFISLSRLINEMHVSKLRISVMANVAQNPRRKWWFKRRSIFIHWIQQRPLLLLNCIFVPTFLFEISLLNSSLPALTFLKNNFEIPCTFFKHASFPIDSKINFFKTITWNAISYSEHLELLMLVIFYKKYLSS